MIQRQLNGFDAGFYASGGAVAFGNQSHPLPKLLCVSQDLGSQALESFTRDSVNREIYVEGSTCQQDQFLRSVNAIEICLRMGFGITTLLRSLHCRVHALSCGHPLENKIRSSI